MSGTEYIGNELLENRRDQIVDIIIIYYKHLKILNLNSGRPWSVGFEFLQKDFENYDRS